MLEELAQKYFLDKTRINNDGHNYIKSYEAIFSLIDKKNIKTLLEIGIGCGDHAEGRKRSYPEYEEGNSLRMWRDYFTDAIIHGIDINNSFASDGKRIFTHIASQSSQSDLDTVMKKIDSNLDMVVDDGSHRIEDQVASFMILEKYLSDDGLYIIEDIFPENIEKFQNLSAFPQDFIDNVINQKYSVFYYDTRSDYNYSNDFIAVFYKKKL
jgi:hypothetical protein